MEGYKVKSKQHFLEEIIKFTEDDLQDCLNNKKQAYKEYAKNKKDGSRIIYAIDKRNTLYTIQTNLQNTLFQNMLFPECVCGFRKRKSYFDFLTPHVSNIASRYYLRLDIRDFFGSIRKTDIAHSLEYYLNDDLLNDEKEWIVDTIVDIITINDKVIQGAVTSPTISNLIFRNLDIRIERYCKRMNVIYTRYADDMLFSSDSSYIHNYKFTNMIKNIIRDKDFCINHNKTLKFKEEVSLNGYVVGRDIRLSRNKLKELNRIIFNLGKKDFDGFKSKRGKYISKNKLAGYRAFLINSLRFMNDEVKIKQMKNKIKTIEDIIIKHCLD